MIKIRLKPLSVNAAWKGRRFRSERYKKYERDCLLILPANLDLPDGPLTAYYEFGMSNRGADVDNPIKPFQDILQKKYGFNDARIQELIVKKVKVKKGEEYIKFSLSVWRDAA